MSETNDLLELPYGWLHVELNQLGRLIRGVSYVKEEASETLKDGYKPVLRANNINKELNFDKLVFVPRSRIAEEQMVTELDIIIAMSSGSKDLVGKAAQARHNYDGGFGAFCGLVRIIPEVNRVFIGYFFQSPEYKDRIAKLSSGVNINNLRREHIELLRIPFPPLPEQHRIVAKIEELFTKLDAGVDALRKARVQLGRYRQSVLKAAVTGELTKEWREAHESEFEPASELLARILRERREKWDADQLAKMKAAGKAPKNDEWKKNYQQPVEADTTDITFVPKSWIVASADQLTTRITSGSRDWSQYYGQGSGTFIMAQNVRMGALDLSYRQPVNPPVDNRDRDRSQIEKDDLLVTIVGANTGDVCRVPHQLPEHYVCQSVALMRLVSPELSPFVEAYLTSEENGQRQYRRYIYGAGRPHLSFDQLKMTAMLIPPVAEQHKIVEEVELLLSIADATEQTIEQGLKQAERLRQSILKQAFAGKLVPQDPSDEPAEVLLARIREERAKRDAAPSKKSKPRPRRKSEGEQIELLKGAAS